MLRTFASHLRHQWTGVLALFLVLGSGTAYAVTQIDRNSVKSKHIVNGEVKEVDLAADAVSNSIAMASSDADVGSGDGGQANPVNYPLTNSDFSTGANEAVAYAAEVEVQMPSTCTGTSKYGYLDIYDGNDLVGRVIAMWTQGSANLTVTERPGDSFTLYSAPKEHSLRAEAYDLCEDGSDFTVKSVKVMAIGVR